MAKKDKHVGVRISAITEAQLDLIKDLRGFPSISALVGDYIATGLALDSTDIEAKIEERLAVEKNRLMALATGVRNLPTEEDDEEDDTDDAENEDEEPDMFSEEEPVEGTIPGPPPAVRVGAPQVAADNSDLVPTD